MQALTVFSLAPHSGPYEKWPVLTPLLRDGVPTGAEIPGYVIEAQYRCEHGLLLITSYDCPFEESNDFLLLDDDYRILARKSLVVPYGSFLLNAHWPVSAQALRLHYYTRLFYVLTIKPPGGLLRRGYSLQLDCDHDADRDPRSAASVADLEARVAAIATDGNSRE